jgi:hypothetical protein
MKAKKVKGLKVRFLAPSYRRADGVTTQKHFPFVDIVVMESEKEEYEKHGVRVVTVPDSAQGNLCRVRNYMLDNMFNDADCLVLMDDDYSGFHIWNNQQRIRLAAEEFREFCEMHAGLCRDAALKFWGVNCVPDKGAYREYTPFGFIQYIGGPLQAFMKDNELRYDENLPLKEDYDMTLQQIRAYGGALRVNYAHYDVKQSEQAGGCATYRNLEKEKEQFFSLQRKWGSEIVKRDTKSKRSFDYNPVIKVPIHGV